MFVILSVAQRSRRILEISPLRFTSVEMTETINFTTLKL